jgi:hypothetical protein
MRNAPDSTDSKPVFEKAGEAKIFYLLIALLVIAVALVAIMSRMEDPGSWMEGPAILIMISFMPLTALTYLHYRLPKKQQEFDVIKAAFHAHNNEPEDATIILQRSDHAADYVVPIFFVSLFSILGFYILFTDSANVLFNSSHFISSDHEVFNTPEYRRGIVAIGMAFLGAYIWSIQYIFRRMVTLDLPPGAYFSVGTRLIYSSFLAVIFQFVLPKIESGSVAHINSQVVVISFLIGIFPDRALSWMRESISQIFMQPKQSAAQLPLEMIEGISGFHKARLNELGIDSVQNLAHASLMELILKTPFKPRVLVDWMAQARLCLEFKDNTAAIRSAGVRTILDFLEVLQGDSETRASELAESSGIPINLIKTIYTASCDEKSLTRLRKAYDVLNII